MGRTLTSQCPAAAVQSLYTAGIICSDLMSRMHVVVDYARRRIAFTQPKRRGILSRGK